ncbi:pentatricopeptide repeat-containing protein, putative [Ricinus communis]|uniref:Pentatricopeptide repeat-containing protein, putative n=3 Tax=Ricinus communis TaxID=3988 RepID=B9RZ85_RICCO|nr:pentatricopeptide repeat-containing protein, putative [Ricinus communis]
MISRYYYANRTKKVTLYSKISPLGDPNTSLVPELDNWVQDGNKVRVGELQRIIRDLRKRNRFTQALEVSEWMNKKGICIFSSTEHAVQLDLIGKVRGFLSAENYFNNLMDHDKTDKTYGALLNCYVRQRQTDRSISHWQKMKEMGLASSPLAYNDIMCLYINLGLYEKVLHVLTEMKENKISPDNFSYRICINSYGARSDIQGMEKVLNEMECRLGNAMDWNTYAVVANFYIKAGLADKAVDALRKSEEKLDKKDGIGYNHLISLYATLGIKSEVLRIWDLQKSVCKRRINRDFVTMLESLVKLGDLEEAEKVLKEWESSGNFYDVRIPNIVVVGYSKNGLHEKAEASLEALMEKGRATTPNSWAMIASGYLEKGEKAKAFECMKAAFSLNVEKKGWKPNPRVVMDILIWLGDEGSPEDVEAFVASLSVAIPLNRQIYHALLKAKIRSGRDAHEILDRMKTDKIDEDEETKEILGISKKQINLNG